jgi:type IV secretion system protein VirB1
MIIDFDSIATRCAPNVAPATLRAMATVESSFNPFAIGVVGGQLRRQPSTLLEGVATVAALQQTKTRFSAGLIQIYVGNWPAYGLDRDSVFDVCKNVRAAGGILTTCYARAVAATDAPQLALRKAISCYYSNNFVTGFTEGYVQKVVAAALRSGDTRPIRAR